MRNKCLTDVGAEFHEFPPMATIPKKGSHPLKELNYNNNDNKKKYLSIILTETLGLPLVHRP